MEIHYPSVSEEEESAPSDSGSEYIPMASEEETDSDGSIIYPKLTWSSVAPPAEVSTCTSTNTAGSLKASITANTSSFTNTLDLESPAVKSRDSSFADDNGCSSPHSSNIETVSEGVGVVTYKKPSRPCIFCGVFQAKLLRHIKRLHKNEESVKAALSLPQLEQRKAFDLLTKEGILQKNIQKQEEGSEDLLRERNQGVSTVVVCSGCKGFFSRRRIYKHKKYFCSHSANAIAETIDFSKLPTPGVSEEFQMAVLNKFRNDAAGMLCRSDRLILLLGQKSWCKSAKKEKRVVMGEMRLIANLILQMRTEAASNKINGEDILNRANFDFLQNAIQSMTKRESDHGQKSGLKLSLGCALKKSIRVMKGYYTQTNILEKTKEVELFNSVLDLNWDFIFYTAQLECERRRGTLRKPQAMPLENDVEALRTHILTRKSELISDEFLIWDCHTYIELRNLVVSRLTIYNARRGGEPARLALSEWLEAEEGHWVDQTLVQQISDPLSHALVEKTKLANQQGKGSRKMVPVLIPNDTVDAVRKLVTERTSVDIHKDNVFLFPNTGGSRDHVSEYYCVKAVTASMKGALLKPELLIADKFRHRASTFFALLDLPEEERESWYRHMQTCLPLFHPTSRSVFQT